MQAKQVGVCGEDCVGDDSDNDRDRACLLESDKYVKKGLRLDLAPRILPSVACLLPMPSWDELHKEMDVVEAAIRFGHAR